MAAISAGMRLRRFKVKGSAQLKLVVETLKGVQYTLSVDNVSLRGIGTLTSSETSSSNLAENFHVGDIIPESKLIWDDNECALGRLSIVRSSPTPEGKVFLGFSCIDARLPLSGTLARKLDEQNVGYGVAYEYELSPERFSLSDYAEAEFQHPDLLERCRQFQVLHNEIQKNPMFQYYSVRSREEGVRTKFYVKGKKRTIDAVSFATYDYLGYSSHPEVKDTVKKTVDAYGLSAAGSLILSGKTDLHDQLEFALSHLFRKEACLIYSSGYGCNLGAISGLMRPNDLIISDIYAHASIQDGIAASRARARFYRHNDLTSLRQLLTKYREEANGALLITEGLFSMEGTTPNLIEFVKIAREFNARTYIDEAHSIGVYGSHHLGTADRDEVLDDIDIFMGTCSKAFGIGGGGFICANQEVIDWLKYFSRAGMFSCALSPVLAAALLKVIELMKKDKEPFQRLKENTDAFQQGLRRIGITTTAETGSPIVPIIVKDEKKLGLMNQILLEHGIYTNCIVFPAVPIGEARFRFSLTSKHSSSDIQLCLGALKIAFERYGG